jgi:hypothetical protein
VVYRDDRYVLVALNDSHRTPHRERRARRTWVTPRSHRRVGCSLRCSR